MRNNLTPYVNPKQLTEASLKKAVLRKATGSGLFQYPLFTLLGLAVLTPIFGLTFPIAVAGILCFGTSSISWLTQMFVTDEKTKLKYILELKEKAKVEIEQKVTQLSEDLRDVNLSDAATQLEQFQSSFKNFMFTLDQRFSPEELAYNRYSVIVQQIVLAGMHNLQTIFLRKKNLTDANPKDVKKALDKLEKVEKPSEGTISRISELRQRLAMYEEDNKAIDELLAQNEKALTAIGNVSRSIASINTDGNLTTNMESAMQDLIEMTDFAKVLDSNYSQAIKIGSKNN